MQLGPKSADYFTKHRHDWLMLKEDGPMMRLCSCGKIKMWNGKDWVVWPLGRSQRWLAKHPELKAT